MRSIILSTRSSRRFQLSRETTPLRFSTWNQSSTSSDMAVGAAIRPMVRPSCTGDSWSCTSKGAESASSTAREEQPERRDEDQYVEGQTPMLEVVKIVRELRSGPRDIVGITEMNLRPAGDSGLDQEPTIPEGHLSLEHIDVLRTLGPGPDDAHLAAEDVPKLRNLVPAGSPEDATDSRDARVASGGIHGHAGLGVRDHRPKLHHLKWSAALTAPNLPVKDRSAADSKREVDQQDERQEDEQRRACDDHVEGALPSCRVADS